MEGARGVRAAQGIRGGTGCEFVPSAGVRRLSGACLKAAALRSADFNQLLSAPTY